ncbi:MAG: chromosome segregation protein SMC, partial [Streptococcus mitis]|nr:chromosome segregation protein SMC [Streptococcus mitis]
NADLPLPGLSVDDGELLYLGQRWDNMSGSQQLQVATAIVRKLKPECGFVLIDKLEQMDQLTLQEFGAWLEQEGLQAIATRVSTGDECSILIEDGYSVKPEKFVSAAQNGLVSGAANAAASTTWQGGF